MVLYNTDNVEGAGFTRFMLFILTGYLLLFPGLAVYTLQTDGGFVVVPVDSIDAQEGGTSNEISTALVNAPVAEVVITARSSDSSLLSIVNPTLTFDSSNWGSLQSFELFFPEDDNAFDDTVTITFSAQSNSPSFVVNSIQIRDIVIQDTQLPDTAVDLEPDEPIFGGPQDEVEDSGDLSSGDSSDTEDEFLIPSEPIFGGPQDSQDQPLESSADTVTSQEMLIRTGGQDM